MTFKHMKSDEDLCDSDEAGSFSCSDSDSDDGSLSSTQYTARNRETWSPLLLARAVRANPSSLLRVISGFNPSVRYKASTSP